MTDESPILAGRRIVLRPYRLGFSDAELERLYAWARDTDLLEMAGGTPLAMPLSRFRALFLAQLPQRNTDREQHFAVLTSVGRLIGRCGLYGIARDGASAELGIVIGERDAWHRGYGRDAVATLSDHAFDDLGLERVVLHTFPENTRAQRAFRAVGFTTLREVPQFTFDRGTRPAREMVLTAADRRVAHAPASAPRGPVLAGAARQAPPPPDARQRRSAGSELAP